LYDLSVERRRHHAHDREVRTTSSEVRTTERRRPHVSRGE
jgi:hypothetical protein